MSVPHATLIGVATAALVIAGSATSALAAVPLPPVSGTIYMGGHAWRPHHPLHRWAHRRYLLDNLAWGSRHVPRIAGYQGGINRQIWNQTYNTPGAESFWNRNVPFYGEGNDTLALTVTAYGTADSATTGGAYPPPAPWHSASVMPGRTYVGSGTWSGLGQHYGYAPTGGLGYYSSSSSAGPNGSPGGLAIYSSGSYGPGPKIIDLRRERAEVLGSGPHVIYRQDDQLD